MLLGAQPGSGKTISTLTAITQWLQQGTGRVLLVAPVVILDSVWQQEASSWDHTQHLQFEMAHRLSGSDRVRLWFEGNGDIVTCSPDTLSKLADAIEQRQRVPFTRVVIDESQLFKNPSAIRTKALLFIASLLEGRDR